MKGHCKSKPAEMRLLNKEMRSHEPKGEKSKTATIGVHQTRHSTSLRLSFNFDELFARAYDFPLNNSPSHISDFLQINLCNLKSSSGVPTSDVNDFPAAFMILVCHRVCVN
jgi:hypothetical protein